MNAKGIFKFLSKQYILIALLSFFVLIFLSGIFLLYADFWMPVEALGNQLYQAAVAEQPLVSILVPLLLSLLLLVLITVATYSIFASGFWYILKKAVSKNLHPLPGFRVINFIIVLGISYLLFYFLPYLLPGVLVDLTVLLFVSVASVLVLAGFTKEYFISLKRIIFQASLWIFLLFVFLGTHFFISVIIYLFVTQTDPYLTNWRFLLDFIRIAIFIFIFFGLFLNHSRDTYCKISRSRKELLVLLVLVLLVSALAQIIFLISYIASVVFLLIFLPVLVVVYSIYLLFAHENKN